MFATPTVVGERLVVASCSGRVFALELAGGEQDWVHDARQELGPEFHGAPLVFEDVLVVASDDRREGGIGHVYGFAYATGEVLWKVAAGEGVMADPILAGGFLVAVTLDEEVIALDPIGGVELWRHPTGIPNPDFLPTSSPATDGERVFFGGIDGTLRAIDLDSGEELWRRQLGGRISTSLAMHGDKLLLGTAEGALYAVSMESGEVAARLAIPAAPVGHPLVRGDRVVVIGAHEALYCVDAALSTTLWSLAGDWQTFRPLAWGEDVIAGTETGKVASLHMEDGQESWSHEFPGVIKSVARAGDRLCVGTQKGAVFLCRIAAPASR